MMDNTDIERRIRETIKNYKQINYFGTVEVTDPAIKFLVQIILNIQEDKSPYWLINDVDDVEHFQIAAIALIPRILDRIIDKQYYRNEKITTWEIIHSLSDDINALCFISKRRMRP